MLVPVCEKYNMYVSYKETSCLVLFIVPFVLCFLWGGGGGKLHGLPVRNYMNEKSSIQYNRWVLNPINFKQSGPDDREAGVRFLNQEYDYRQNWTARSPTTY